MGYGPIEDVVTQFMDLLPVAELMPQLSAEDVQRFVALGERAQRRQRAGDVDGAAADYRTQTEICGLNPEPFVRLAMLHAARGDDDEALRNMRLAVVRGFTDLMRIENAEAWQRLRRAKEFLKLQDAVPTLVELEEEWPPWDAFRAIGDPGKLATILERHESLKGRVTAMEPALGERAARLWDRLIDRAGAAMLEEWVVRHRDAANLDAAVERLLQLYAGGSTLRWDVLPAEVGARMTEIAKLALERLPGTEMRPTALVAYALGRNADRDKRGRLSSEAEADVRSSLEEVLADYPHSPVLPAAAVGLVRLEVAADRSNRAAAVYRKLGRDHAEEPAVLREVRSALGELALWLGGLPEFRATTLDGTEVDSAGLRGKVTVVDFWATWCKPCVEEFPTLRAIEASHPDDVTLVGVSLDDDDALGPDALRAWIAEQRLPGRQVQEGTGWESELVGTFGVREIPFVVVVDPTGNVVAVNEHGKKLERAVERATRSVAATR